MNELSLALAQRAAVFGPVVPFDPNNDRLIKIDFSESNPELTDSLLADTGALTAYFDELMRSSGARYGIGGYGELRRVYSHSRVFDAPQGGGEPRRLHIGTDIWGKPHTPVMAPFDSLVHSFGNNDRPGDYGFTIILSHLVDGLSFYTLYGHLGRSSITNLREGDRFDKGDMFAEFGIPSENGHWPPHLHFQVIGDLEGWSGDYPGVCRYSERAKYMANCPDPDILLQLNQYA